MSVSSDPGRAVQRLVIVGASGFAREVKWLVEEINQRDRRFEFVGFVVSDLEATSPHDSKNLILGDLSWLDENLDAVDALALGFGNPVARDSLGLDLERRFPDLAWPALVHPSVHHDRASCEFGKGVLICAGVIATVGVRVEPFAMVNLACTLGHETAIGRGCVLNPTVNVSGGVTIGDRTLVGTGAQILQYVCVGSNAKVGAGAVVTKDVAPGTTVVGIPARSIG